MSNGIIGKISAGGGTHLIASTAYFTCNTQENLGEKACYAVDQNLDTVTLIPGFTIYVKFTYSNTYSAGATLRLYTSSGHMLSGTYGSIRIYGDIKPGKTEETSWRAGAIVSFTYDGTYWVMHSSFDSDAKNTAGSTNSDEKLFLIGATSQAESPQTYSDSEVYTTNGQLDANKIRIAENVTLTYNSTEKTLDFIFA